MDQSRCSCQLQAAKNLEQQLDVEKITSCQQATDKSNVSCQNHVYGCCQKWTRCPYQLQKMGQCQLPSYTIIQLPAAKVKSIAEDQLSLGNSSVTCQLSELDLIEAVGISAVCCQSAVSCQSICPGCQLARHKPLPSCMMHYQL